jgi:hypothetical protein
MRRFLCVSLVLSALSCASNNAYSSDESICAAPLSAALLTVRTTSQDSDQNAASTAWQCSFSFSSHDEAIGAGLQVGAVVYGVPLKVGGQFDKKTVDQWKTSNCSRSASSSSFKEATVQYLREVAPGAMGAFSRCIGDHQDKSAVTCSVARESGQFAISWRKLNDEPKTAAPVVTRILVANGTCASGIAHIVPEGGTGTLCTPTPGKDLVVMVGTTRGLCTATAPYEKSTYPIVGTLTLESDKEIAADVVEFRSEGRIVTNGHSLRIQAAELHMDGNGGIIAFASRSDQRAPGTSGRSAGSLIIKAGNITGSDLRIDLTGEDGAPGQNGGDGKRGPRGGNAQGRGLVGLSCGGGHAATPGGSGTAGGDGGNGGNGGNGGVIVVQLVGTTNQAAISRLNIVSSDHKTIAGSGGAGGNGGVGGAGGDGGGADSGSDGCGGRGGANPGPKGSDGKRGTAGSQGSPGPITIGG